LRAPWARILGYCRFAANQPRFTLAWGDARKKGLPSAVRAQEHFRAYEAGRAWS